MTAQRIHGAIWSEQDETFAPGTLHITGERITHLESEENTRPRTAPYILPGFFDASWTDESNLFENRLAQEEKLSNGITTLEMLTPSDPELLKYLLEWYPDSGQEWQHVRLILHVANPSLDTLRRLLQEGMRAGCGNRWVRIGGVYLDADSPAGEWLRSPDELKALSQMAMTAGFPLLLRVRNPRHLPEAIRCYPEPTADCKASPSCHHRLIDPPVINESLLAVTSHLQVSLQLAGTWIQRRWKPLRQKKPDGHYLSLTQWLASGRCQLVSGGDYPTGLGLWKTAVEQLFPLILKETGSEEPARLLRWVKAKCLTAMTQTPARLNHLGHLLGTLRPQAIADLLLLESDPLEENEQLNLYPHLKEVLIGGQKVDFW